MPQTLECLKDWPPASARTGPFAGAPGQRARTAPIDAAPIDAAPIDAALIAAS
jgi:hypothetical protein